MNLEEITNYLKSNTGWSWEYMGHKVNTWEFRATDSTSHKTRVLVPFKANMRQCDKAIREMQDYFTFFSGGFFK